MSILLCTELKVKVCARRPAAEQLSGPAYRRCGQPGSLGPNVETSCPNSSGCCPLLFLVLWSSHQPKPKRPHPSLGSPSCLAWDSPWLTKVMCYVTRGRPWCSMVLYRCLQLKIRRRSCQSPSVLLTQGLRERAQEAPAEGGKGEGPTLAACPQGTRSHLGLHTSCHFREEDAPQACALMVGLSLKSPPRASSTPPAP